MNKKEVFPYQDILYSTRPISKIHPKMSLENRAAQFAPFKALSSYESSLNEATKDLQKKKVLNPEQELLINKVLVSICCQKSFLYEITYFIEDLKKHEGSYHRIISSILKVREFEKELVLIDKSVIKFKDIYSITLLKEKTNE